MGVPAFFRWLTKKYPSVIAQRVEEKRIDDNEVKVPNDTLGANTNGVEFDNLYLDMNGIIHSCTHPEDKPAPKNEAEMMIAIYECIDRLFNIVRPRKLLYMAIDGVAPRAKMNQQRSRRFRAIKETVEKFNEINKRREELLRRGATLPPRKSEEKHFDTNCITPGTHFMARLSECLNYYIHDKVNFDPGWSNIKVILSDSNVPGEGEHKIMDFIRKQRAQPYHDPNTHHCLYGADADLIMLGLATHEVNFTIIREEFKPNKPKPCDLCGQIGHVYKECEGGETVESSKGAKCESEREYIFVRLNVLREYLERELYMPNLSFEYDFERAIDDWVFMCLFVGNDFLPHLPSLEVRGGAIDKLVKLYKDIVYKTRGYLTEHGDVSLDRLQLIMLELGKTEAQTFRKKHQNELNFKARERKKKQTQNCNYARNTQFEPQPLENAVVPINNPRWIMCEIRKANMKNDVNVQSNTALESTQWVKQQTRDETDNEESDSYDEVKLWEEGFKDRYYESKFDMGKDNLQFRYDVGLQYVKGLCWVLQYYIQGCPSWNWYFPYYYAPFASDVVNISELSTKFETKTKPFNPLEQLMSVFPASSSSHVPLAWADLMINETSAIIDFYPKDFKIDLNGKKFAWQGIALLPFVDENRLLRELAKVYGKLTSAEKKRNTLRDERLYIGIHHEQYQTIAKLTDIGIESEIVIDGIQGTILPCTNRLDNEKCLQSPLKCLPPIEDSQVCCVSFRCLKYPEGFVFPSIRLKGACEPLRVLKLENFEQRENKKWKPNHIGMNQTNNVERSVEEGGYRILNHHELNGTYI